MIEFVIKSSVSIELIIMFVNSLDTIHVFPQLEIKSACQIQRVEADPFEV